MDAKELDELKHLLTYNVIAVTNLSKETKDSISKMLIGISPIEFKTPHYVADKYRIYIKGNSAIWINLLPNFQEEPLIPEEISTLLNGYDNHSAIFRSTHPGESNINNYAFVDIPFLVRIMGCKTITVDPQYLTNVILGQIFFIREME